MSTLKIDTLLHSSGSTTTEPSIPALDQRMAKAWVNFNGSSTVAIRDSYNVSSITDNGTGTYTVNFTNAMADTNYVSMAHSNDSNHNADLLIGHVSNIADRTAGSDKVLVTNINTAAGYDIDLVTYIAFGN